MQEKCLNDSHALAHSAPKEPLSIPQQDFRASAVIVSLNV